jgi:hypothetical protein
VCAFVLSALNHRRRFTRSALPLLLKETGWLQDVHLELAFADLRARLTHAVDFVQILTPALAEHLLHFPEAVLDFSLCQNSTMLAVPICDSKMVNAETHAFREGSHWSLLVVKRSQPQAAVLVRSFDLITSNLVIVLTNV